MPYIKPEQRPEMDEVVAYMKIHDVEPNGKLNYVLYKFCKDTVSPSYNEYKNFLGELRQCANEIERRLLNNYENSKIAENGDVE